MSIVLNQNLIEKQGLTAIEVGNLEMLHREKEMLFASIEMGYKKALPYEFEFWVAYLRNLEFRMQKAWGFDVNENYHYWFDIPHCSCPKMDNEDYRGTNMNVYDETCKFHGQRVTKRKEAQYQHNREIKRWNEHDLRMIRNSFEEAIGDAMDKVRESYND